ncbi:MAG: PqiC family protein [Gammaproteobacteria bacterium]
MMRRLAAIATLCALAALAAGCASPPSRFYTLSGTTTPAATSSTVSVAVGPVSIPAEVDRPEIVVSTGPNQVQLDEFNRWASPLENNMARVIAENLVAMLGTPRVSLFPQALSADADYRVAIEVQSFRSVPGEAAVLDAVWTVRRAQDGRTETRRTSVREAVQENGYDALAAAHSRALARMSRDIADAVRALDRSGQ